MSVLGDNIRKYRKIRGLSQEQIAESLGYKNYTTIQKWESGVSEPPFKKLAEIADILRISMRSLTEEDVHEEVNPRMTEQEKRILSYFSRLTEEDKIRIEERMKIMLEK